MEIVYLKKGERPPKGDKSLLVECRPGGQSMDGGAGGVLKKIGVSRLELPGLLASLEKKGLPKVYVRGAKDA